MVGSSSDLPAYYHTQKGPWHLLLYAVAAAFLTASWSLQAVPGLSNTFLATGIAMLLLGACLGYLTISDEGERLAIAFGPVPLFRRRVRYDDIVDFEKGRTTLLDGWGIHWSLRGGWVWNIWGYDCVVLRLKKGTLHVGTDDPEGLVDLLASKAAGIE